VKSLFTLFVLTALVWTQGTSLATSICRHGSLQAHIAARQSHDTRKAAVAYAEETADSAAGKKGSVADSSPGPLLIALLPASAASATLSPGETVLPRATDRPPLAGLTLRPPLPPPLG